MTIERTARQDPAVRARIKEEEVVLKKSIDQRSPTVSDKVRHTDVKVEDDRRTGAASREGTKR